MSTDIESVAPARQDLFLVVASPDEVRRELLPYIRDMQHAARIQNRLREQMAGEVNFLVTRSLQLVQYWPFLNMRAVGSAWCSFGETHFSNLSSIKTMQQIES
jgi:hypothetical protein